MLGTLSCIHERFLRVLPGVLVRSPRLAAQRDQVGKRRSDFDEQLMHCRKSAPRIPGPVSWTEETGDRGVFLCIVCMREF